MCDAFLTLAHTRQGLTCFLVPRWWEDGTRNPIHIQRLKDKLGNRSNASSEIEYHGAWAWMVGPEGRGVATIIEMVNHTRLDCVAGASGLMRRAVAEAIHHATYRAAFGATLRQQPLMANVLADLALETEAATTLMLYLASLYGRGEDSAVAPLRRIVTAIAKYWVCKRAPGVVGEALECHGGNGYVEASVLPRLYRESPLLSIWEGSGNVMCLDVLRAMVRDAEALPVLRDALETARGADLRYDAHLRTLQNDLTPTAREPRHARRLVEALGMALQGMLLIRHAPPEVAEAFCAARLGAGGGYAYGTLPAGIDLHALVDRAAPTPAGGGPP